MAGLHAALAPFTLKGFYLLTWGTALGANIWHSGSAVQAYTTLTRDAFAKLTNALQPIYFATSTVLTGTLLGLHLRFHPILVGSPTAAPHWYQTEEGVQAILITTAFLGNLLNWTVVGPNAAGVARERAILEKQTGKAYDANPSAEMQAVNNKFSTLHGIASALNGVSLLALVGLGLAVSM